MIDWLLSPIDPTRAHHVAGGVAWHGRLMVLAWGLLFPAGIVAARFFKVTPGQRWPAELDNKAWWHAHRGLQYAGGAAMLVALALILAAGGAGGALLHPLLGWSVAALAAVQFGSAWARGSKGGPTSPAPDGSPRGDHYDMTARRVAFERIHKGVGYTAMLAATLAIPTGLWAANAPVWMWALLACWWALLAAAFAGLQRRGLALDTYQAIWGPDPRHPGNRRAPIGWGVRRRH